MFDMKATIGETIQEAITSMKMIDEEGEITTTDVSAKFVNGKPVGLSVSYLMQSSDQWDRFIRFMDRYAACNELGFAGGAEGTNPNKGASKARSQGV
jgi:photosystem II protein